MTMTIADQIGLVVAVLSVSGYVAFIRALAQSATWPEQTGRTKRNRRTMRRMR